MQYRVQVVVCMLFALFTRVIAQDSGVTYKEMARTLGGGIARGAYSQEAGKAMLQALYQQAPDDAKSAVAKTYKTRFQEDISQAIAPKAPAQAPEGVSEDFKKLVSQIDPDNKKEDAIQALKFLFGEADSNDDLYRRAEIAEPQEASEQQVGANLKTSINADKNIICE